MNTIKEFMWLVFSEPNNTKITEAMFALVIAGIIILIAYNISISALCTAMK